MAANIEIEAKVLIKEEEYHNFLKLFNDKITKQYEQTNYYIDTEDFKLKQLGIGLRIRCVESTYTLTLKAPMAEGLLEKDQLINKETFEKAIKSNAFPEGNIKEFVTMLGINTKELKILATLKTFRTEIDDGNEATTFSADKNEYSEIVDYELELEGNAMQNTKNKLKEICEKCNITYKDNVHSKQTRAMAAIK